MSRAWAAQPRGVGGHCPPTFEAKGVQRGTMKMMYSSQFRLYSGVRRGSILFHLLSVLELPGAGGFPPTAVVDPQLIHGVEVSALLAPRRRPPLLFS